MNPVTSVQSSHIAHSNFGNGLSTKILRVRNQDEGVHFWVGEEGIQVSNADAIAHAKWILENVKEPTFMDKFKELSVGDKFRAGGAAAIKLDHRRYALANTSAPHPVVEAEYTSPAYHFAIGW